jgi:two-component system chemotaxis response regulator CheB
MRFINKKVNVLLVDDDSFLVMLYKKNAESYLVDLNTALSGEEALELIRTGLEPHAILLDINMPGMSGVDVLRTIRGERLVPSTDIIIVSNAFEEEYAHDFKEFGIEDFIPKTHLSPSRILDRVVSRYVTPSHVGESFMNSTRVF